MEAHVPRKMLNTSEISGRKWGSWFQQRSISAHSSVLKVGCAGRGGRVPCVMHNTAMTGVLSLNGIVPVNTCIHAKQRSAKMIHTACNQQHTSIITIAKEKVSASLLNIPSVRTSGAAHRGV